LPTQNNPAHLLVGVTGGIGSGKSTVCELFRRLGRTVIGADAVAREVMEGNAALKRAVRSLLGPEAYRPDGGLAVKAVAEKIFTDAALRARLNAAVFPAVIQEIHRRVTALRPAQRSPYVIIEAALIYESGMDADFDYVIVVHASEAARIARVEQRDGATRAEVVRRARAQMPAEELRKRADFVLINESEEGNLVSRVAFLDRLLSHGAD
jgi:dephospho-CoA kinase